MESYERGDGDVQTEKAADIPDMSNHFIFSDSPEK